MMTKIFQFEPILDRMFKNSRKLVYFELLAFIVTCDRK